MNNGRSVTVLVQDERDAGVHAMGQVIHFDYPQERPLENALCVEHHKHQEDIAVRSVERVFRRLATLSRRSKNLSI